MATGIVTCGQGGGVLVLAPLLQTMIDSLGWRKTYQIMAGLVPVLCLSGLTYSPNVQSDDVDSPGLEGDAKTGSADSDRKEQETQDETAEGETSVEKKKKGCQVYITVWKEPKFVATVISASVMMFGHYVPQIHLVNIFSSGDESTV